jgi:hypothetical protein
MKGSVKVGYNVNSDNLKYTKFSKKYTGNVIEAEHINTLQKQINATESDIVKLRSHEFKTNCLNEFNGLDSNFLYINELNKDDVDNTKTSLVKFNSDILGYSLMYDNEITAISGHLTTKYISFPTRSFNKFYLMIDAFIPLGGSLEAFIVYNDEYYPISYNEKLVCNINATNDITDIAIRFNYITDSQNNSPVLYSYALMCYDKNENNKYGLLLQDYSDGQIGDIVHTHTNKVVLDEIGEINSTLTYKNVIVSNDGGEF